MNQTERAHSTVSGTDLYLYIGRGDCRVDSQNTAGYKTRQISARPAKYTPMNVARAPTVLARSSVLQMLEAMSEAIPRGDTYMMAVTCKEGGTQPQQVCNWCLPTCMHVGHIKSLLQHPWTHSEAVYAESLLSSHFTVLN